MTELEFRCFYFAITLQEPTLRRHLLHPPPQREHNTATGDLPALPSMDRGTNPSLPSCQAQAQAQGLAAAPACPARCRGSGGSGCGAAGAPCPAARARSAPAPSAPRRRSPAGTKQCHSVTQHTQPLLQAALLL